MKDKRRTVTHYLFADLVLDVRRGELSRDTSKVALPKLSYDLLVALVESAPALLSQQALMQRVWPERVIGDETLKQRVKLLRKVLGDDATNPFYIESVRGRGYRILPEVTCNCIVQKPPSVMLDLTAHDQFPSFSIHQISSFWRKLSKGGLFILSFMFITMMMFSMFNSTEQKFSHSRIVFLPSGKQLPSSKSHIVNKINDTLITTLSKVSHIQLVSPGFINDLPKTGRSLDVIAKKFNAGLVLEEDMYLSPDNILHVRLKLTDINIQTLIWHADFSSSINGLSDLQQELSKSLEEALTNNKKIQVKHHVNSNETAAQYLEKAKQYYNRYRKVDNGIAIDFFNRAITADPRYSLAYAGLSQAYSQQLFQFDGNESDRLKAIDNAYQAITYDNRSAEAYKALGSAYYISGWLSKSIDANLTATTLSPNNIEIMTNIAFIYSEQGKLAEALSLSKQVLLLEPTYVVAMVHNGITLQRLAEYEQAQWWFDKAIAAQPDYILATYHLGQLYIEMGQFEQAINTYIKALERHENHPLLAEGLADSYLYSGALADAYTQYMDVPFRKNSVKYLNQSDQKKFSRVELLSALLAGERSEELIAKMIVSAEMLHVRGSDKSSDSYNLALLFSQTKKTKMAIRYLVQAVEQGLLSSYQIEKQPLFKELRSMNSYLKIIENIQQKQRQQRQIKSDSD